MNSWELEVFDRLSAEGLELVPQYGSSGFRIDMVAKHPDRPGDFVLAIECDGASYHSSRTARERDRLRQQILENLGWRFHRIWSTDWWNDSQNEVRKVLDAFQRALRNEPVSEASTLEYVADEPTSPARPYWRPDVPKGHSISEYDPEELEDLARWINCDGRLRTEDEVVEEMIVELGFKRRGARINRELRRAARAASSS
jgi:very-short-patch-repair endonuclease